MHKIGVFDSGVGGKSVVAAIKQAVPDLEIVYAEDPDNVPYGDKTPERLIELVIPKLKELESQGCEVIVVACNTVTTTIIKEVRRQIKVPIVAIEPMVKPACELTKSNIVAMCATPVTLKSPRYKELLKTNAKNVKVIEPDCSDWSCMIENNEHNSDIIEDRIVEACEKGADVIVLGCTHYHWIEEEIKQIANRYNAMVIQPEQAIINQLKRVLEQL
ncbi:glutamate racemase [Candidatus Saccharibacteria bacterium]|nr:glutamate racemase [Candidatus Saccharibacteria bacterium]